jgi:hypothetical protein
MLLDTFFFSMKPKHSRKPIPNQPYNMLKLKELKDELRKYGLSTDGQKLVGLQLLFFLYTILYFFN